MDKLEEIRKALESAAPRPWESDGGIAGYSIKSGLLHVALCADYDKVNRQQTQYNANLIANAPSWLSYLLSELDAAEKDIADLERIRVMYKKSADKHEARADKHWSELYRLRKGIDAILYALDTEDLSQGLLLTHVRENLISLIRKEEVN